MPSQNRYPSKERASGIPVRTAQPTMHRRSPSAPSKLQQLQMDYQAKLMREKEQKLQSVLDRQQQQQNNAYNRIIRNGSAGSEKAFKTDGNVRNFFKQRRIEQSEVATPPGSGRYVYKKNSAGKDKSNPLQPLNRPTEEYNKRPFQRKRSSSRERTKYSPQPPQQDRDSVPKRPIPKYRQTQNQFGYGSADRMSQRGGGKMSDFQKWQQEQDEAREKR